MIETYINTFSFLLLLRSNVFTYFAKSQNINVIFETCHGDLLSNVLKMYLF